MVSDAMSRDISVSPAYKAVKVNTTCITLVTTVLQVKNTAGQVKLVQLAWLSYMFSWILYNPRDIESMPGGGGGGELPFMTGMLIEIFKSNPKSYHTGCGSSQFYSLKVTLEIFIHRNSTWVLKIIANRQQVLLPMIGYWHAMSWKWSKSYSFVSKC